MKRPFSFSRAIGPNVAKIRFTTATVYDYVWAKVAVCYWDVSRQNEGKRAFRMASRFLLLFIILGYRC